MQWGYFTLFEAFGNGRTPGKRVAKIRVIHQSGRGINFVESLARNLVRIIDYLPGFYAVGVVAMFMSRRHQRLGDMVAGTLVVRDREVDSPHWSEVEHAHHHGSGDDADFAHASRRTWWLYCRLLTCKTLGKRPRGSGGLFCAPPRHGPALRAVPWLRRIASALCAKSPAARKPDSVMMWRVRRRILMLVASGIALMATVGESAVGVRARTAKPAPQSNAAALAQRPASDPPGGTGGSGLGGAGARPTGPDTPPAALPLDNGWGYAPDPGNVGVHQGWFQGRGSARIPNGAPYRSPTTSTRTSRPGRIAAPSGGTRSSSRARRCSAAGRWAVHFEGVRRHAEVWLNGELLGSSTDPYAPFTLTAAIDRARPAQRPRRPRGQHPRRWLVPRGLVELGRDHGPGTLQPVGRFALSDLGVLPQLGLLLPLRPSAGAGDAHQHARRRCTRRSWST